MGRVGSMEGAEGNGLAEARDEVRGRKMALGSGTGVMVTQPLPTWMPGRLV